MEWTIGKDRLTFKKTFSTKEILFTDIVEITVGKNLFRLTTPPDPKSVNLHFSVPT